MNPFHLFLASLLLCAVPNIYPRTAFIYTSWTHRTVLSTRLALYLTQLDQQSETVASVQTNHTLLSPVSIVNGLCDIWLEFWVLVMREKIDYVGVFIDI